MIGAKMQSLPFGWHYGEGGPTPVDVVCIFSELRDCAAPSGVEASPGVNGEILLAVYEGNRTLDLMIEPGRGITATLEDGGAEVYDVGGLTVAEAKARILALKGTQ